jgi:hypothetical protein
VYGDLHGLLTDRGVSFQGSLHVICQCAVVGRAVAARKRATNQERERGSA